MSKAVLPISWNCAKAMTIFCEYDDAWLPLSTRSKTKEKLNGNLCSCGFNYAFAMVLSNVMQKL